MASKSIASFISGAIQFLLRPVETEDQVPIWSSGQWYMAPVTEVGGGTTELQADLANQTDPAKGAALVGYVGRTMADETSVLAQFQAAQRAVKQTLAKVRQAIAGSSVRPVIYVGGDSVATYAMSQLYPIFFGQIGLAGLMLGATGGPAAFVPIISGDVITQAANVYDFTYWPTGSHYSMGPTGVMKAKVGGGAVTGTKFYLFYVKSPGMGTATVDLMNAAETVVQQTTNIDTDGVFGLGYVEFTEAAAFTGFVRITQTGSAARVIVVGFGYINTTIPGVVMCGMNRGGLELSGWSSAPAVIWKAAMAVVAPDLGTLCMRESASAIDTYLDANYVSPFREVVPNMEWIGCGVWPWGAAPAANNDFGKNPPIAPSWLEGEAMRRVMKKYDYGFYQSYDLFGYAGAKEVPSDIHLTPNDERFFGTGLNRSFGFNQLSLAPTAGTTFNASTGFRGVTFTGTPSVDPNVTATWRVTAGPFDVTTSYDRTLFFFANMNGTPSEVMRLMGGGNGVSVQVRALSTLTGFTAAASYLGDLAWLTSVSSGGVFTKRWLRSTTIRETTQPGYSIAFTGSGTPIRLFDIAAGDTAYSTLSDYSPNEGRLGYDSVTKQLRMNIAPSGLGALREVIQVAIDATKGRGSTIVAFAPTDDNYDTTANFVSGQMRFAVSAGGILTAAYYDGATLKTLTLGTFI